MYIHVYYTVTFATTCTFTITIGLLCMSLHYITLYYITVHHMNGVMLTYVAHTDNRRRR